MISEARHDWRASDGMYRVMDRVAGAYCHTPLRRAPNGAPARNGVRASTAAARQGWRASDGANGQWPTAIG